MWDKLKVWAAPVLALALLSASALQANGQVTPEQIQETASVSAANAAAARARMLTPGSTASCLTRCRTPTSPARW